MISQEKLLGEGSRLVEAMIDDRENDFTTYSSNLAQLTSGVSLQPILDRALVLSQQYGLKLTESVISDLPTLAAIILTMPELWSIYAFSKGAGALFSMTSMKRIEQVFSILNCKIEHYRKSTSDLAVEDYIELRNLILETTRQTHLAKLVYMAHCVNASLPPDRILNRDKVSRFKNWINSLDIELLSGLAKLPDSKNWDGLRSDQRASFEVWFGEESMDTSVLKDQHSGSQSRSMPNRSSTLQRALKIFGCSEFSSASLVAAGLMQFHYSTASKSQLLPEGRFPTYYTVENSRLHPDFGEFCKYLNKASLKENTDTKALEDGES